MTASERKQMQYLPGEALDAAIVERFGKDLEPDTSYNIFSGRHVTTFVTEDPVLRQRVDDFVDGFTKGVIELRERLQDKSKWL